jgi:HTH-type transcriptional regulator/antitoxin HigA
MSEAPILSLPANTRTANRMRRFLEVYAETGRVREAAARAGVHRTLHYRRLKNDPAYQQAFRAAQEQVGLELEDEAVRRPVEGVKRPVLYKGKPVKSGRRIEFSGCRNHQCQGIRSSVGKCVASCHPHRSRERTLHAYSRIFPPKKKRSTEEQRLTELLTLLIENFEEREYPMPRKAGPIDIVRHLMAANGLRQTDLLDVFGTPSVNSEVLKGKRELSKTHIVKLSKRFHVSPELFF